MDPELKQMLSCVAGNMNIIASHSSDIVKPGEQIIDLKRVGQRHNVEILKGNKELEEFQQEELKTRDTVEQHYPGKVQTLPHVVPAPSPQKHDERQMELIFPQIKIDDIFNKIDDMHISIKRVNKVLEKIEKILLNK